MTPASGNQKRMPETMILPLDGVMARKGLILIRIQDDTNSLVFLSAGFVPRSLQIAADMRLASASPEAQTPARLSLILKAHWN